MARKEKDRLDERIRKAVFFLLLLLRRQYLVDNAVLLGFLGGHEEVSIDVLLDLTQWLAGILREHLVEVLASLQDMFGRNLYI